MAESVYDSIRPGWKNRKDGERTGHRDLTYSKMHRALCATDAYYCDIDGNEYCGECGWSFMQVETKRHNFRPNDKQDRAFRGVTRQIGTRGFHVVYWTLHDDNKNCECAGKKACEIVRLMINEVYPIRTNAAEWSVEEWIQFIDAQHAQHDCDAVTWVHPEAVDIKR